MDLKPCPNCAAVPSIWTDTETTPPIHFIGCDACLLVLASPRAPEIHYLWNEAATNCDVFS